MGVGASAGGLDALERLLRGLPGSPGLALLLVQHLDPRHESRLTEILSRVTRLPVCEAKDGMRIEPDHVYTIPPNASMVVRSGRLSVRPRRGDAPPFTPIDDLFRSLAHEQKGLAIGVILSGTASDGAAGMLAIKRAGGRTLAQDAASARYFGMPQAAMALGAVDLVLPPEEMARQLPRLAQAAPERPASEDEPLALEGQATELSALFGELKRAFGVDFGAYKQSTVGRRIRRRMGLVGVETLGAYLRVVRTRADELRELYQEMFVGVTSFFREPETFVALRKLVFPRLVKERQADGAIRIWVPGCSTGEEVYSIAISLLEFLKDRAGNPPIQIFGSDINEDAIRKARLGRYAASIAPNVGRARLARFFARRDDGYQVNKAVRDLCVFARHDVLRDPPLSRLDLLSCRNLLIYLGPSLQQRLLPRLHYGLRPGRFLLLGSAETVGGFSALFELLDRRTKIYVKKPAVVVPRTDPSHVSALAAAASEVAQGSRSTVSRSDADLHRDAADLLLLNQFAPAAVLVNEDMEILHFRGRTGDFLEAAPGVASLNLMKMTREGLLVGLRSTVETARRTGAPALSEGIRVQAGEQERTVSVRVVPVRARVSEQRTYLVLFEEAAVPAAPEAAGQHPTTATRRGPDPRVGQLRQELNTTKAYLQSVIESQEAGNEELRSMNEELLSTNEELQSANEELITLNEELQCRNADLGQAHSDILNLLSAVRTSVVVVDHDQRIRQFTALAETVLGLRGTDVGRPLAEVRLKADIPELEQLLRRVIGDDVEIEQDVQDESDHWYSLRIRPYTTAEHRIEGAMVTLTDIHATKQVEERFRVALLGSPAVVFHQDCELRYTWVYNPLEAWKGVDIVGSTDADLFGATDAERLGAIKRKVLASGKGTRQLVSMTTDGDQRWYDLIVEPVSDRWKHVAGITCAAWDVTEQQRARDEVHHLAVLEERNRLARELHDSLAQGLVGVILQLEAAEATILREPEQAPRLVRKACDGVRGVLEEVRRSLLAMRPALLDRLDLPSALGQLAADLGSQTRASVRAAVRGAARSLDAGVAGHLFRIAQEGMHNAVRHADAKRIRVDLTFEDECTLLSVSDDGRGFDPGQKLGVGLGLGLGLEGIKQRCVEIGATLAIDSRSGQGTRLTVRLAAGTASGATR